MIQIASCVLALKCINLPNCTKFCSTDKLKVSDKFFALSTKNYLMDWQIRDLEDDISGNILVVCANL